MSVKLLPRLSKGERAALLALADWERTERTTASRGEVRRRLREILRIEYTDAHISACLNSLADKDLVRRDHIRYSWRLREPGRRVALLLLAKTKFRCEEARRRLRDYLASVADPPHLAGERWERIYRAAGQAEEPEPPPEEQEESE